ncbi:hypothetical protein, partial [Rathayibacter tritici]|uniref:hypothetical protein n=1 Tax=Rathayibacter tritici TaxID=33888 RepID=UPI000D46A449
MDITSMSVVFVPSFIAPPRGDFGERRLHASAGPSPPLRRSLEAAGVAARTVDALASRARFVATDASDPE